MLESLADLQTWLRQVASGEPRRALAPSTQSLLDPSEIHLLEALGSRQWRLSMIEPYLFVLGEGVSSEFLAAAREAFNFVIQMLGRPGLIIVEPGPPSIPTFVRIGRSGLAHITLEPSLRDRSLVAAMVHEFTHAVASSGRALLDEGLATLLEHRLLEAPFSPTWWERPTLPALLTADWSEDPHFESLCPPSPEAPYQLGAWLVERVWQARGSDALLKLFDQLRRNGRRADANAAIRELTGLDLYRLEVQQRPEPRLADDDAVAILAYGDVSRARKALPIFRAQAVHWAQPQALGALARCAITAGMGRFDTEGTLACAEGLAAIQSLGSGAEPLLQAYRRLLDGFCYSTSPIERRVAGVHAVADFATLLRQHPEDPECLIAAAKAQTYSASDLLSREDWRSRLLALQTPDCFRHAASSLLSHERFQEQAS
jgi:hypothetical protein